MIGKIIFYCVVIVFLIAFIFVCYDIAFGSPNELCQKCGGHYDLRFGQLPYNKSYIRTPNGTYYKCTNKIAVADIIEDGVCYDSDGFPYYCQKHIIDCKNFSELLREGDKIT